MEEELQAGREGGCWGRGTPARAGGRALLLHHQLEHLLEVEHEARGLHWLALQLGHRPGQAVRIGLELELGQLKEIQVEELELDFKWSSWNWLKLRSSLARVEAGPVTSVTHSQLGNGHSRAVLCCAVLCCAEHRVNTYIANVLPV